MRILLSPQNVPFIWKHQWVEEKMLHWEAAEAAECSFYVLVNEHVPLAGLKGTKV